MTPDPWESTPVLSASVRINVHRVAKTLLLTLVIPVSAAILIDVFTGTLPVMTIVASLLCIPLSSVVVGRTLVAEMDRVISIVAPEAPDEETEDRESENERGVALLDATS